MTHPILARFIEHAVELSHAESEPCQCVLALAPSMMELIDHAEDFLEPEHYRADPAHYSRNLIYCAEDADLSLFALVWSPGQWTPVHDHGSWGVVGIVEGVLEERSYVCLSPDRNRDDGIELVRGGVILLPPGSVTTFVPNPDHIHVTGVPAERPRAVSLHLYGRMMNNYHIYDVAAGTREMVQVEYNPR
ncbi:cysteine dioxygenase family protein [Pseudomonas sp. SCB32]|uniref:cysteine dioxygenase family protein n=1 Tax=Pseudomonas sp. SCB32 TaxID=2653853 RepID=UPI001264599C|nr:cysteine dioxygenase family protein [Pseudomonas sp. SCB32]